MFYVSRVSLAFSAIARHTFMDSEHGTVHGAWRFLATCDKVALYAGNAPPRDLRLPPGFLGTPAVFYEHAACAVSRCRAFSTRTTAA